MLIKWYQLVSKSVFLFIQVWLLVTSDMVFSYEDKVIIKYLRIKYKYGATRTVNDHPGYKWNINDVKKLLKKIVKTGDIAWKEGSGGPKSVSTEENIELILNQEDQPGTQFTSAEIARELDIDAESNRKVNAKYYCNVVFKKRIPEMNILAKHKYLFMRNGVTAYTAKLSLEMLKQKKQL